jgi:hypothetical protein
MFWLALGIPTVLLGIIVYQLECLIHNQKIIMKLVAESAKCFDRKISSRSGSYDMEDD